MSLNQSQKLYEFIINSKGLFKLFITLIKKYNRDEQNINKIINNFVNDNVKNAFTDYKGANCEDVAHRLYSDITSMK